MGPGSSSVAFFQIFLRERKGDVHSVCQVSARHGIRQKVFDEQLTDGAKQLIRVPDLGKYLNQGRLRSDIPSDLFLSSAMSCLLAANCWKRRICILTVEQTTFVEVRQFAYSPSRPIVLVESSTEALEPLVHPRHVLRSLLLRDDILDYGVLHISAYVPFLYAADLHPWCLTQGKPEWQAQHGYLSE